MGFFKSIDQASGKSSVSEVPSESVKSQQQQADGAKVKPPKNKYDNLGYVVLGTLTIGIIALILEGVAFQHDAEWNLILNSDKKFPSNVETDDPFVFSGKLLVINPTHPKMETVEKLLFRSDGREFVAVVFMGSFAVLVLLTLLLYIQQEASKQCLSYTHSFGAFLMFISAILILLSDLSTDQHHLAAAKELEEYYEEFVLSPPTDIPLENIEVIKEQLINFMRIEKLCALGANGLGRYTGSFGAYYVWVHYHGKIKRIPLQELRALRFCSEADYKLIAFIMCLLYALVCFGVPGFVCYYKSKKAKAKQVKRPKKLKPRAVAPATGGGNFVSPSGTPLGYNYEHPKTNQGRKSQGQTTTYQQPLFFTKEKPYNPKYLPVAPADLGILVSTKQKRAKSSQFVKMDYEKSRDKSYNPNEQLSFDSFEPHLFASYGSLAPGKGPKKSEQWKSEQKRTSDERPKKRHSTYTPKVKEEVRERKKRSSLEEKPPPHQSFTDYNKNINDDDFEEGFKHKPHVDPLPEVPKEKRVSVKAYVYQSPYSVRKN